MHPGQEEVNRLIGLFKDEGIRTEWDETRDLIQLWATERAGPHTDIWLWEPDHDSMFFFFSFISISF